MSAGFIAVELVERADGKMVPDLGDADTDVITVRRTDDQHFDLTKGLHSVTLVKKGRFAGNLIFEVSTSTSQAWNALKGRLGAKLFTYIEAKDRPAAQLAWIEAQGYRVIRSHVEGEAKDLAIDPIEAVAPRHVLAGQSPIDVAVPDQAGGRIYYSSEWSP